jgi:ATP-dependent Clp protease ATP-binding subunit ClpC
MYERIDIRGLTPRDPSKAADEDTTSLADQAHSMESLTNYSLRALLSALERLEHDGRTSIPEAILLAIISEKRFGYQVFQSLGVDMDRMSAVASSNLTAGREQPSRSSPLLFPIIVGLAAEEAFHLGHDYVGTEHLILALMRGPAGQPIAALLDLGLDIVQVRVAILKLLIP